jgi:branched-chain amino acid transport system ATP-binding protein
MSALLSVAGLVAGYGRSMVLHDVSLTLGDREVVCLLGANGAGKSTLLAAISGLLPLAAGSITFAGDSIGGISPSAIVRRGLAQVPERRQLFGGMTVEENLLLGAFTVASKESVRQTLERCYALFPRLSERRKQVARSMSGGEQQMLAVGRALMSRPRVLLLDEPTLGLAPKFVELVLDLVRMLRNEGTAVLIVEQNAQAALEVADRGYVLATGRITQEGSAASLLEDDSVRSAYLGGHAEGGTMEARLRRLGEEMRGQAIAHRPGGH